MTRRAPEHSLQVFVVNYLRYNGVFCFAVPNGGRRDAATGAMLKKEGALAGVSDLILLLEDGETVFVELKDGDNNKQSATQIVFEKKVKSLGFTYLLWKRPEDVIEFVKGLKIMKFRQRRGEVLQSFPTERLSTSDRKEDKI